MMGSFNTKTASNSKKLTIIAVLIFVIVILNAVVLFLYLKKDNEIASVSNGIPKSEEQITSQSGDSNPAISNKTDQDPKPNRGLVDLVYVDGGTFIFGCQESLDPKCSPNELPARNVDVDNFYISRTEVTQEAFERVMGYNPAKFKGLNRPVETVNWLEAIKFCNRLSESEGLESVYTINGNSVYADFSRNGYRLPTEFEWEYAAKGGKKSEGYKFSGGNFLTSVAWCSKNSKKTTHEVAQLSPNELGLYDMTGNVWEWCWDEYRDMGEITYDRALNQSQNKKKTLRGGSYIVDASLLRVTTRYKEAYEYLKQQNGGFRICRRA
jgi:sulfatase modifying factor 1